MANISDLKERMSSHDESDTETEAPRARRGRRPLTPDQRAERERTRLADEKRAVEANAQLDAMLSRAIGRLANAITIKYDLPPELDEQEQELLAEGAKPLIYKYLPGVLDMIGPELIFGCTLWFVYGERWMAKKARERAAEKEANQRGNGNRKDEPIETTAERVS